MSKISDEQLIEALGRCVAESEFDVLSQHRYSKWRESLPNRRVVPNPLAFGNAAEFVVFSEAHGFSCLEPGKRTENTSRAFMSKSQLSAVLNRFIEETGSTSSSRYRIWRSEEMAKGALIPSAFTISRRFDGWANALLS